MTTSPTQRLRVVVFGGTGRTGTHIARKAVHDGHAVVCVGRSATQASVCPGSEAFAADVQDADAVANVLKGADVAVIALSIPRRTSSPFAPVVGPKNLHSVSMQRILDGCRVAGVSKVVKLSAQGVGDSAPRAGLAFRVLIQVSNLRYAFSDHAVADQLLATSEVDWTIVRPPILSDAPGTGSLRAGETLRTTTRTQVPRSDVADFVVSCFGDPTWSNRCVTLAPATS